MPSEFYLDKFERSIPLTGLFMERLGLLVSGAGGQVDEAGMLVLLAQAMQDAHLVEATATDEQVQEVVISIEEYHREQAEKADEPQSTGKGKHFAGYFSEWASALSYDKLCFYAAGYDYAKAREYFESHDQRLCSQPGRDTR